MHYRVAIQAESESCLKWKSTPLTSLEALFQLLRRYRPIPQDRLRVFTASSREQMDDMLAQENSGEAFNSVTAEQFLCERGIGRQEMRQRSSTDRRQENGRTRTDTLTPLAPLSAAKSRIQEPVLKEQNISALERKRLELEMGTAGDHDQPYTFTLPVSTPQLLAWTRLMIRVQQGELQP